jgi:phosphopantothenoylcysteine decarboxylase/phosphopantothenate--cysteine ligase
MEEPEEVVALVAGGLDARTKPLTGRHIVVTAGPTREPLDPVRAITNISSGKMGYALAAVAFEQGAEVTLISGPVALRAPAGVQLVHVVTAAEMEAAVTQSMGDDLGLADCLIMAAAVCDFRPSVLATEKLKRGDGPAELSMVNNPDILSGVGHRRSARRPVLVGFALETARDEELVALGRQKLIRKQVDLIVANSAEDSLGKEDNVARLVSARDCTFLDKMTKMEVARHIISWVTVRLQEPDAADTTH